MAPLESLRSGLQQARTRWSKLSAAPQRWRRRRWALHLKTEGDARSGSALAPEQLMREGFSPCDLDIASTERLLRDWRALKDSNAGPRSATKSTGKAFFEELLSDADLERYPAFLETALAAGVVGSVMKAMGMVPHLESVDILASTRTGDELRASQLWHYDVNDARIIKLFVYLEDCGTRNGPFTFIPADTSQRVASAVGHYVHDEHIAVHVPRSNWQVVEGAAGTAFFIDTGRCYHFGSRCELPRYAYVATYSSGRKFMRRSKMWRRLLGPRAAGLSQLQRVVCDLSH